MNTDARRANSFGAEVDATSITKGGQAMTCLGPAKRPCCKGLLTDVEGEPWTSAVALYQGCKSPISGPWLEVTQAGIPPAGRQTISSPHVDARFIPNRKSFGHAGFLWLRVSFPVVENSPGQTGPHDRSRLRCSTIRMSKGSSHLLA
jgi:hypothetical protein